MCLSLDGGDLNYDSSTDIAGFQFSHNGCVTGASGGDAAANGFTVSASGSTVLAFSFTGSVVPAGAGTLVELSGDISEDCLSDFIFSDASGGALVVAFAGDDSCASGVYDCAGVCDGDAVEDCAGDCGGDAVVDECGECDGDGIGAGECDCAGNVEDCFGDCGGDAVVDECGECNGPGAGFECIENETNYGMFCSEEACYEFLLSLDDCPSNTYDCANVCDGQPL